MLPEMMILDVDVLGPGAQHVVRRELNSALVVAVDRAHARPRCCTDIAHRVGVAVVARCTFRQRSCGGADAPGVGAFQRFALRTGIIELQGRGARRLRCQSTATLGADCPRALGFDALIHRGGTGV